MKSKLLYLLLTFLFSFSGISKAQSHSTIVKEIESRQTPMILQLKNGDVVKGNGYISNNTIYLVALGETNYKKYDDVVVDFMDMKETGKIIHFEYKKFLNDQTRARLFRRVSSGKIDVYLISNSTKRFVKNTNASATERGIRLPNNSAYKYKTPTYNPFLFYDTDLYYVSEKNQKTVKKLTSVIALSKRNFEKSAADFFKDCPNLVTKIKNKHYKKEDIVRALDFYNNTCE